MRNQAAAAVIAVLVAVSLGAGYLAGSSGRQNFTVTSTATMSTTTTVTAAPGGKTSLARTNGDWSFAVRLPKSPITRGFDFFSLSYNLTNVSGQPQKVHVVDPLVNPAVYSSNGTLVWAWDPPTMNYITTVPYGPGNWSSLAIPTYPFSPGQQYVVTVYPLIGSNTTGAVEAGDYSIGQSLMINATISFS